MTTEHTMTTLSFDQAYNHLTATLDERCLVYFEDQTFLEFCTVYDTILERMINELKDLGVKAPSLVVITALRDWHNMQETKAMQLHPDNF